MKRWPIGALIRDEDSPELGPGHLLDLDEAGRGQVAFLSNPEMSVDFHRRPLRRQRLPVGARVCLLDGEEAEEAPIQEGIIEAASFPEEGLYTYQVRLGEQRRALSEAMILPLGPEGEQPLELLEGRAWRGPFHFIARQNACASLGEWGEISEGLPALIGARRGLDPRAVFAIRRLLMRAQPKGVLFGGSPESRRLAGGLFVQAFLSEFPESRVLIIAPGARLSAWQVQLSVTFGGHAFSVADPEAPESFEGDRLLLSHNALRRPATQHLLSEQRFTLIVLQQAHTLSPKGDLYTWVRDLIAETPAFLGLSARLDDEAHEALSGLLGLILAPEAPHPPSIIKRFAEVYAPIWRAQASLEAGEVTAGLKAAWGKAQDPTLRARLEAIEAAPEALLSYSRAHHRFEPRLISLPSPISAARPASVVSYTPSALERVALARYDLMPPLRPRDPASRLLLGLYRLASAGAPEAAIELLSARAKALGGRIDKGGVGPAMTEALLLDPSPEERRVLLKSLMAGCPPMEGELDWLTAQIKHQERWRDEDADGCARFVEAANWIGDEAGPGRLLVFVRSAASVEAFANTLRCRRPGISAVAVHGKLPEDRKARLLREFQEKPTFKVLITDDDSLDDRHLGVLQTILHLEPPAGVMAGLRRGAAAHARTRAVIFINGEETRASFEAALNAVYQAAEVYTRGVGEVEAQLPALERLILTGMARDLSAAQAQAEALRASARPAWVMTGHAPTPADLEAAVELCEMIEDTSEELQRRDARYFTDWAQTLGLRARREEGRVAYGWTLNALRRPLWRLGSVGAPTPVESPVKLPQGTFDREVALDKEAVQFFAPGHRFIDALIDDLMDSCHGRAAVFSRDLGEARVGSVHLVALLQLTPALEDLPQGLALAARAALWPRWEVACFTLEGDGFEPITDPALEALLTLEQRKRAQKIEPEALMEVVELATLWRAVAEAEIAAMDAADEALREEASAAAEAFLDRADDELARLRWRAEVGEAAEAEASRAQLERIEAVARVISEARSHIDALAVIVGVASGEG
ncbi:hypothetical protein KKF91_21840 [Myxococcota bacterium]|nr:hypothetical protein [Myxococcota bacterium]